MKNISRKSLPLIFIPFLSACTGGTIVISDKTASTMSVSNMSGSEIYFSCKACKGEIIYQFNVSEKQSLSIKTNVEIDAGTVTFTVTTTKGEVIFEQGVSETSNFEMPLKEYGKHRVKINHESFKGSYRLNWSK